MTSQYILVGNLMSNLNRVLWACRRGMLECDLFLIPFANNRYLALSAELQQDFETLLKLPDQTLYRCLMGEAAPVDLSLVPILDHIRAFKLQALS